MSFLIRCVFMDLALSLEGLDLRHSLFTTIKPVLHVCLAGKFNIKICPKLMSSYCLQQTSSGLLVIKRISFYYKCLPRVYQDCCPNVGPSNGVKTLVLGRWVSHIERVFCCAELFTLGFHVAMSMVFCAFVRRINCCHWKPLIWEKPGVNLEGDPLTDWDHSILFICSL